MIKFPRAFCVTLKETPIRTKAFMDAASKIGLEISPFYGVFGQRLQLIPRLSNEIECPGQNIFMTDGAVGCYLSHYILWNVLLHLPEDEFLIFEDDAILSDDFMEKFEKCYLNLPSNWDIAYVGWLPYGDNKNSIVVNDGISIRIPSATHAYMIKKSVIRTALDSIQPCSSPIDLTIINKLLPNLKYYVFDPSLVSQQSYLNASNSIWSSLVYDWKNDLYGNKQKIIKEIVLSDGWYSLEKNLSNDYWRWSKQEFTIKLPANIDTIAFHCSSPIENSMVFTMNDFSVQHDIKMGDNIIVIDPKGGLIISGGIITPFSPKEYNSESTDIRKLGICLKKIVITTGPTNIEFNIQELSSNCIAPMSFKL